MTPPTVRVLLVEDDNFAAAPLMTVLEEWRSPPHRVTRCASLDETLRTLGTAAFDVAVLDLGLPDSDGALTVSRVRAAAPDLPIVVLSGQASEDTLFEAMRAGAQEYLVKGPLASRLLPHAIGYAIGRTRAETEIRLTVEKLRAALDKTVNVLATALEVRDPYTAGHQRRVAGLACAIAAQLNLDADRIQGLRVAGKLHDIGKISVPSEILSKPTRLTHAERLLMQSHPQTGHDIIRDVDFPWPVARIVLEHHERLDGSGYPRGLRGDRTLVESQILGVADVVEAMSSHRPYRSAMGVDAALGEIRAGRGSVYLAPAVDACVTLLREEGFRFE